MHGMTSISIVTNRCAGQGYEKRHERYLAIFNREMARHEELQGNMWRSVIRWRR